MAKRKVILCTMMSIGMHCVIWHTKFIALRILNAKSVYQSKVYVKYIANMESVLMR